MEIGTIGLDLAPIEAAIREQAHQPGDPVLYAIATIGGRRGVWRSDDGGASWVRINDDAHQWGPRFRAISGDPQRYGRVYTRPPGAGCYTAIRRTPRAPEWGRNCTCRHRPETGSVTSPLSA